MSAAFRDIAALARPSSVDSEANIAFKSRGVRIVAVDLTGPKDDLVKVIAGMDIIMHSKDDMLAAIQRLYLPYTSVPAVPSGRTNHVRIKVLDIDIVPGDGSAPVAYTDLPDIGMYVAKIIADPRTLNKKIFAHTETLNAIQMRELVEELSGERVTRNYMSAEDVLKGIASARVALEKNPVDLTSKFSLIFASYLGYLNFEELYPDMKGKAVKTYIEQEF
ncbi:isoflavone reductase family protein [Daldinia sp. FL1419]|nr:isoflavone reductase family protein [Daldinia sp. FL1419]